VTGELALFLALDAVRLACVTLSHGALLICAQTARRRCGGWRHLVPRGDGPHSTGLTPMEGHMTLVHASNVSEIRLTFCQ
jgi:hypothetical protein